MSLKRPIRNALVATPLVLIGLVVLSPFANYAYLRAYKEYRSTLHVTDPTDPRFKSEDFDSANYAFENDLGETLQSMFPAGTPRTVVDRILVPSAHVKLMDDGESKDGVNVLYGFPKRIPPLPQPSIHWCGEIPDSYWHFWFAYSHPSKPGVKSTMLLQTITWTPGCD